MAYQYPLNGGRINASIGGNSTSAGAGYSLVSTGTLHLQGGNNITLSQNGQSVSIVGGDGGIALANSQTTYTSGTANLVVAGGAMTIASTTGQSYNFSVPEQSSLSQTGALSISRNGNTISIGVPAVSMGMSNIGNTSGTSGTASNQLVFAGGNNVTLSQSTGAGGNTLTISAANQTVQTQNMVSVLGSSGNISFANANNVTFGGNASTVTASASFAQSNQNVSLYALGNTTQNSSTLLNASNLSFNGLGGATVGYSNGSIQLSAPVVSNLSATGAVSISNNAGTISIGAPAFSAGLSNIGNTAGTSGTASNQIIFAGGNNVTLSQSTAAGGHTLTISAANQTVQTQNLHNLTLGGNSTSAGAGYAQVSSGTLTLAGGNNITLSQNGNAVTVIGGAGGAAGTNTLGVKQSDLADTAAVGTYITGTNLNLAFAGGDNVTLSQSINGSSATITVSAWQDLDNVHAVIFGGNTGGDALNADRHWLHFYASNNMSFSMATDADTLSPHASVSFYGPSTHRVTIGGNSTSAGAGYAQISSGTLTLAGGNNITLSQNGNAVTISGGAGGGGIALANSQTTYTSGTANLVVAGGALTIASTTGQSYNFSAPATSSLSATGALSISTNGSTISMGVPAPMTYNYFNPQDAFLQVTGNHGQATLHLQPSKVPNVQFDRIAMPIYYTNSSNSTASVSLSVWFGVYTRTSNSFSLASSISLSSNWTGSGTVSASLQNGIRLLTIGSTNTIFDDQYYFGIISRSTTAGGNGTLQQIVASQQSSNFSGIMGVASNASAQYTRGLGHYSVSTTGMPNVIAMSELRGTAPMALRQPLFYFVSQTF
jgi:hypothetical protein